MLLGKMPRKVFLSFLLFILLTATSAESVDCAVCHKTYHMNCVRPKLTKKPARGFAWACALCSRAQERKLEARNTSNVTADSHHDMEEDLPEEDDDEPMVDATATGRSSPATDDKTKKPEPATAAQIAQAKMWPYRYFGIHCQVEDALDYDDRIYPRASSRIGTRHQAMTAPWYGQPVQYTKPLDARKKAKGTGKGAVQKMSKETQAAIEAEKQDRLARPWVMDEPTGFIRRGEDEPVTVNGKQVRTAELLFKMPEANQIPSGRGEDDAPGSEMTLEDREKFIDEYMTRAKEVASERGLPKYHTNFLDKALEYLYSESFNVDAALKKLKKADLYKDLKEPKLNKDQKALFEEGVSKYGSEWLNIRRHIGNIEPRHVVRYYYMWKKTPEGRRIWGSYEGRRGKKEAIRANSSSKLLDDIADEQDDSAFDNDKATDKKRGFQCKFCTTRSSPQWRRAPLTHPGATVPADPAPKKADKGPQLAVALCHRCAIMWRKYAIEWKDADELAKKLQAGGNKAWRRKMDEEMLAQMLVSDEGPLNINSNTRATAQQIGVNVNGSVANDSQSEPAKKKPRTLIEKDSATNSARNSVEPLPRKKATEKPAEPIPIIPDHPRQKTLPCAVCRRIDSGAQNSVTCKDCQLTVHRRCYGVNSLIDSTMKWYCDTCSNDRNPTASTRYECTLCPVTVTEHELMEAPPKSSNKKKTDRDKEKEKMDKEVIAKVIKNYQEKQEAAGKPIGPREPLKRTAGYNWVHVNCAVWHPEIKFGNAEEFEPADGFTLIPRQRYKEICKLCKTINGACVSCDYPGCNAKFHVGCAFQAEYGFGFGVSPVKGSRKESTATVRIGEETGLAYPTVWCSSHTPQTIVHDLGEHTDQEGLSALGLYVKTYKQADVTIARKTTSSQHVSVPSTHTSVNANRRASAANAGVIEARNTAHENGEGLDTSPPIETSHASAGPQGSKACFHCKTTFSPRWWSIENPFRGAMAANGMSHLTNGAGLHARTISQNSIPYINGDHHHPESEPAFECHKCHLKKPMVPPSESRPPPYAANMGHVLPGSRAADYTPPYVSHAHPPQAGPLTRPPQPSGPLPPPPPPPAAHSSEWYNGYEKMPGHGVNALPPQPNGFGPPVSYSSSHLPHLNGYNGPPGAPAPAPPPAHSHHGPPPPPPPPPPQAPHHAHPAPGHYGPVPPPPPPPPAAHPYPGPPYAPSTLPSPHAPQNRPFGTSMSPPDIHASIARRSPPHALGTAPRGYPVERVGHSPSLSRGSVDPPLPSTPNRSEEQAIASARPTSSGRYVGPSGSNSNTGASASPSLKNLLS
jgi:hypothetical protein